MRWAPKYDSVGSRTTHHRTRVILLSKKCYKRAKAMVLGYQQVVILQGHNLELFLRFWAVVILKMVAICFLESSHFHPLKPKKEKVEQIWGSFSVMEACKERGWKQFISKILLTSYTGHLWKAWKGGGKNQKHYKLFPHLVNFSYICLPKSDWQENEKSLTQR